MQTVVLIPMFERDIKDAGIDEDTLQSIVSAIAAAPKSGDLIPGAGGARKVRHAAPGRGKSGSYRTLHYYAGPNLPVFMLAMFRKGDKANLSKAERNAVAKMLPQLAARYKAKGPQK